MRIFNALRFKKFIKSVLGLSYMSGRIIRLEVEKAPYERVLKLEQEVSALKAAIAEISNQTVSIADESSAEIPLSNKRMIFVCGLHRSGTSVLTKILQSNKHIMGFENTGVIEDEGQFLQNVYLPDSELGWPGGFGFVKESHLTESSNLVSEKNKKKLLEQWSYPMAPDPDAQFFIEKSPPNLLKTRFLQALFPDAIFIVIKRHPVAVAMATKKWNASSHTTLIKHWLACYGIWEKDKQHIKNYVEIKYENFVVNPDEVMKKIFDALALDYDIETQNTVKQFGLRKEVNEKYFNEWNTQHTLQKRIVDSLYGSKIKSHDY